jgi:cobalt-precorrin 5A hydrolase
VSGKGVGFSSDVEFSGNLPEEFASGDCDLGVHVGYGSSGPFAETLELVARDLSLGVGCRKDVSEDVFEEAVSELLRESRIDERAITGVFSIDLKAREAAILAWCERRGLPFVVFDADVLSRTKGSLYSSEFVLSTAGVDNVCERSALAGALSAGVNEGARLVVGRSVYKGAVTMAVATNARVRSFDR